MCILIVQLLKYLMKYLLKGLWEILISSFYFLFFPQIPYNVSLEKRVIYK